MNILAIDTSTSFTSIAVARNDTLAGETLFSTDRTLSARLLPEVERMLELAGLSVAEIDLFGCSTGPGSFTGVRAGVATVQGLALATGKPCAGFSSLALLAMNIPHSPFPVCPLLDARKSEAYAGLYDCSPHLPQKMMDDCVIAPHALAEQLLQLAERPVLFLGDGAVRYREELTGLMGERALFAADSCTRSRASNGILLARHIHERGESVPPDRLLPSYIRPSEAELNRRATTV